MRDKYVKDIVSAEEWDIRVNLAACCRALVHFKIEDFCYNHLFARVPEDNNVLVPPLGISYDEMTASDFIKVDFAGLVIFNPHADMSYNKGILQHLPVLERRTDINCLIHSHAPAGTAVSMLECGLLPYTQSAMRFKDIPYFDYSGNVIGTTDIDHFMKQLGNSEAIILRNHGVLVVNIGIGEAFNTLFFLEQACNWQLKAQACNTPLFIPEDSAVEKVNNFFDPAKRAKFPGIPSDAIHMGTREWPAVVRLVDRLYPGFRE